MGDDKKTDTAETPENESTALDGPGRETVTLDEPLKRGKSTVDIVQVRKPNSGELRGVNLADLLQLNTDALTRVLPRITAPALTEADIRALDPADLVQLGGAVANFLVSKRLRDDAGS